jgi:hypothetical protein
MTHQAVRSRWARVSLATSRFAYAFSSEAQLDEALAVAAVAAVEAAASATPRAASPETVMRRTAKTGMTFRCVSFDEAVDQALLVD